MLKVKQRRYLYRVSVLFLCALLTVIITVPAYAAGEITTAANYLVQHGIYKGDDKGNLNLDTGLTRAELAVILTRLDFADAPDEWTDWGEERFSNPEHRCNTFTDIPNWALPYIEYCYQRSFMKGVAATQFNPQGVVNPKMACTVMLRYCGVTDIDWNYDTSVEKAQNIGIAPVDGMSGDIILRGTMAVVIYRGIQYAESGVMPSEPTKAAPVDSQPVPESPDDSATMTLDEMKAEIIRLTNIERVKAGLPELEILPELMDCAQAKADDMRDNHYFGHTSPKYGSANDMVKALVPGYRGACENINLGGTTPADVIAGWVTSEEHNKNLLDARVTHIGVGIAENSNGAAIWVQQLMRK